VHPIGAHLFGFWLWNADDLASQYGDLDSVRSRPEWFLFPALGAALFWRGAAVFVRGLMVSAAGAVALWLLLSGHPRYLLPAYPMLALLSAWVLVELWSRSGAAAGVGSALGKIDPRLRSAFAPLLFAAVAVNAVGEVSKVWDRVVPEGPDRGVELARHLAGYDLLRSLGDPPVQTLYQFGFEDEIYYLGRSVRGDWFGPGRYADVLALSHNAPALARHLERLGADGLLLNLAREPFSSQPWDPALPVYFELVGRSGQAALYRLRGAAETAPGGSADQPLNRDAGDGRPLSPTARDLAP
jgi:hypothetical protein